MNRIRLVKPEKARAVEDLIIRAAQSGQVCILPFSFIPFFLKILFILFIYLSIICLSYSLELSVSDHITNEFGRDTPQQPLN